MRKIAKAVPRLWCAFSMVVKRVQGGVMEAGAAMRYGALRGAVAFAAVSGAAAIHALAGDAAVAAPVPVVIATPADVAAFDEPAPFVFDGAPLQVHHSFATDREVVLAKRAEITVGPDTLFTLNGTISSQAAPLATPVEKLGAGTLALHGDNQYMSNTILREGVLLLGGAAAAGAAPYTLEQQRGTVLQLAPGAHVVNHIQVLPPRPGDTPLQGLENEAQWRVESGMATLGNNVSVIVPVAKTGEGSLRITHLVQSQSTFRVGEGALVVEGMVAGPVDIEGGARLEGTGAVRGMRVHAGGMLAPGGRHTAATFTSMGNVVFDPGSEFHVNAYPDGSADMLEVHGVAQLDGRVWAEAGAGEWAPEQRYPILSASDGLADTEFESAQTNLAFLKPALEYDANSVYLLLSRNDLSVGDVGDTPDDQEVGEVIDPAPGGAEPGDGPGDPVGPADPAGPGDPIEPGDPRGSSDPEEPGKPKKPKKPKVPREPSVPEEPAVPDPQAPDTPSDSGAESDDDARLVEASDPNPDPPDEPARPHPLRDALLAMTRDEARSALRQLSGSWHASVRSFVLEDSRHVRDAISASGAALASGAIPVSDQPRAWAHTYAATGRRNASDGVAGDRHDSHGVVMGLDAPFGRNWRLGGVLAAQQATLRREAGQARAGIDSAYAGLVAHGRLNSWRVTLGLLRAWHRIDSHRRVSAGPLNDLLGATHTGRSLQAMFELAPALRAAGPYLRHAWVRLRVPAFQESGGAAAHEVQAWAGSMHATTLGWRVRHAFQLGGRPLELEADAGWRHVWGSAGVESTQRFAAYPAAGGNVGERGASISAGTGLATRRFTSQGVPLTRNAAVLSLGLNAEPARDMQVSLRYSGLYGSGTRSHAAWAALRWAF